MTTIELSLGVNPGNASSLVFNALGVVAELLLQPITACSSIPPYTHQ